MNPPTPLTPLRAAGYDLRLPPRPGTWRVDPAGSFVQLCLRTLHRYSFFSAPVRQGSALLTEAAGTSAVDLRFDSEWRRRGTRQALRWLDRQGFGSEEFPAVFGSSVLLASPDGWRMCGRLSAEHLDAVLVADARISGVRTQANGQDAMLVHAVGVISRGRALGVADFTLGPRVAVRIRTRLIHD